MVDDKIGCLIMNIGTPSDPTIKGIRSYLREFLSDPEVIDTNPIIRWAIVNLFVAPFRPKAVLPQYQSIWTKNGCKSASDVYCSELRSDECRIYNSKYIFYRTVTSVDPDDSPPFI